MIVTIIGDVACMSIVVVLDDKIHFRDEGE
jgi:hypothetical protein